MSSTMIEVEIEYPNQEKPKTGESHRWTLLHWLLLNVNVPQLGIVWEKSLDDFICLRGIVLIVNWWRKVQSIMGETIP